MENVGRCPKCGAFLVAENYETHRCRTPIDVREIDVDYYFETDSGQGRILIAKGLDGVLYRLILRDNGSMISAQDK